MRSFVLARDPNGGSYTQPVSNEKAVVFESPSSQDKWIAKVVSGPTYQPGMVQGSTIGITAAEIP